MKMAQGTATMMQLSEIQREANLMKALNRISESDLVSMSEFEQNRSSDEVAELSKLPQAHSVV